MNTIVATGKTTGLTATIRTVAVPTMQTTATAPRARSL
jgi:hypothetical protein